MPTSSAARSDRTDLSGEHPERKRRQLYGRRKGPKLSATQAALFDTLLPQIELRLRPNADPLTYFSPPHVEGGERQIKDVWFEIGFGAGEHLLWQAQQNPHIGLIGAEPYESGVAKLLSRIASLASANGGEGRGEGADNIRIHMGDARDVIEALPDASLGRVFILFPDPWPKTRHHKRRFLQTEMLSALARVMKPGAQLRFASDDAPLLEYTLERLMAHPHFAWAATRAQDWLNRPDDWPPTRYEAKELHGKPAYLEFVRG